MRFMFSYRFAQLVRVVLENAVELELGYVISEGIHASVEFLDAAVEVVVELEQLALERHFG